MGKRPMKSLESALGKSELQLGHFSPSLIKEQIKFLKDHDIPAFNLAYLTVEDNDRIEQGLVCGVAFSSPEYLLEVDSGIKFVSNSKVQSRLMAICVDESHCVVKWGLSSKHFKAFRECYGRIAELRSRVPRNLPVIALTATASLQAREEIIESLGMCSPVLITESPEKANIRYSHISVSCKENDPSVFKCFADELQVKGQDTPRTIIFCRTHRQVRNFYSFFKDTLPSELMKRVAMFHSTTEEARKDSISESFQSPDGTIRILFCTIAFGMGVNVKGVTRVVHFGPPECVDDYVQESGRAGRGGEQSYAILVTYPGCTRHKVSAEMKEYFRNKTCKRKLLLQPFGSEAKGTIVPHLCCDVCAKSCTCCDDLQCSHAGISAIECQLASSGKHQATSTKLAVREVQQDQLSQLKESLIQYHSKLIAAIPESDTLLCGDVTVGFPAVIIDWILRDVRFINSAQFLHQNYPFFSSKYSDDVWDILCSVVGPPSQDDTSDMTGDPGIKSDVESDSSTEEIVDSHSHRAVVVYSSSDSN